MTALAAHAQRLADLEVRNRELQQKLEEAESNIDERAMQRVLEVMPDLEDAIPPHRAAGATGGRLFDDHRAPSLYPDPTEQGGDEEIDEEGRLRQTIQALNSRLTQLEDKESAGELDRKLEVLQEKYPRMDRFRVQAFLAQLDEPTAARVNLERLAEISHRKAQKQYDDYAEERIRQRLAELGAGGNPPPDPGKGHGTDGGSVKIGRDNASQTLAERLASSNFVRGR